MKKLLTVLVLLASLACVGYSQSSVKVCLAPGETYFSNGFEEGSYNTPTTWGFDKNTNTAVNTTRPHSGTYSSEYHFNLVGVGDHNLWQSKVLPASYEHIFYRIYLYQTTPVSGPATQVIQRKFMRVSDSVDPGSEVGTWICSLTSFQAASATTMELAFSAQAEVDWNMATLNFDQWYSVEIELVLNTPGSSDGTIRLWIDGVPEFERTNRNIRGSFTGDMSLIVVGAQVNHTVSTTTECFRYIDDVKVTNYYIGP